MLRTNLERYSEDRIGSSLGGSTSDSSPTTSELERNNSEGAEVKPSQFRPLQSDEPAPEAPSYNSWVTSESEGKLLEFKFETAKLEIAMLKTDLERSGLSGLGNHASPGPQPKLKKAMERIWFRTIKDLKQELEEIISRKCAEIAARQAELLALNIGLKDCRNGKCAMLLPVIILTVHIKVWRYERRLHRLEKNKIPS